MSRNLVEVEYSSPTATIYMNRPHVLNAYNEEVLDDLKQTFNQIFKREDIKSLIITGRGNKAFTVGADLNWLETLDAEQAKKISKKGQELCRYIESSSRVIIAAINGYALGGGMEIALACDLRIASTRARFGQPEVSLGIIPGFDGTQRLPGIVGMGRAKELLFTGNIIDAEQASEIGLVNKLVTPRDLIKESQELAQEITEQSSQAITLLKKVIKNSLDTRTSEVETEAFGTCFETKEHLERMKNFREVISEK
ncbi:MAG: enoyl-CoA hydratase/isomerase family protein [Halanaerobiaceae bacterium]